jgi:monoamine oxidase
LPRTFLSKLDAVAGAYTADKVIVAVPLGLLKANAINFNPPLPANHAAVWPCRSSFFLPALASSVLS